MGRALARLVGAPFGWSFQGRSRLKIDMTGRHRRTVQAVRAAIYDRLAAKDAISPLSANTRIDAKACLVTGANSGLGKAVAIDLATRGARVLMACRSGHPTAAAEVRSASGSTDVEQLTVDLADLESVHGLCDELRDRAHQARCRGVECRRDVPGRPPFEGRL